MVQCQNNSSKTNLKTGREKTTNPKCPALKGKRILVNY